jgi:7-keto-8-aminopelargonate synthetase-like enzyme
MDENSFQSKKQKTPPLPRFMEKKLKFYEQNVFMRGKNRQPLILGKKPTPESLLLKSNDYLALLGHPVIVNAQIASLQFSGPELLMSAVYLHEGSIKDSFERKMAAYVGFESAVLTQSGWVANIGLLQMIADKTTPVYIDFYAHMSLWEGAVNAGATAHGFKHNSVEHLEKLIKKHGSGIIVVDSVYSSTGAVAPLVEIVNIAHAYDCVIVVDESHSLGTHGPKGAGLIAELKLTDKVHFITASLAKAFAGRAGIIFCNQQIARCFPYVAHTSIFSSTVLALDIAGLSAALQLIMNADDRRQKLHENAHYLRAGLERLGYGIESQSHIIAIVAGKEADTEHLRDTLEDRNIFGSMFCEPATAKNRSLVRLSLNSALQLNELDMILAVFADIRDEVDMWQWRSTKRQLATHEPLELIT